MRVCAVFDLDGTIIDNSSENVFFKEMLKRGVLPFGNLVSWGTYLIRTTYLRRAKANKVYLRGLDFQYVCDIAKFCVDEYLINHISPRVYDLIKWHRDNGHMVFILSGSLKILVSFFGEQLEVDQAIGNTLEVKDGKICGQLTGTNLYAENKATVVQQLAEQHNLDLNRSYAYGNHHSDHYKLQLFGNPVAVNPDRGLRRISLANNWQIEMFHENST